MSKLYAVIILVNVPILAALALIGWLLGGLAYPSLLSSGLFSFGMILLGIFPSYFISDALERKMRCK